MHSADPSGLATLSNSAALMIPVLRQVAALASPYDILRVLAPDRAAALTDTIRQISDLSDYVQSVCGHLAANEALEPAHDVIFRLLRLGADFGHAVAYNPVQVAAAAVAPLCIGPDVDGTLEKTRRTVSVQGRNRRGAAGGICYRFQEGVCDATNCQYRNVCARCSRGGHGRHNCFAVVRHPYANRDDANNNDVN